MMGRVNPSSRTPAIEPLPLGLPPWQLLVRRLRLVVHTLAWLGLALALVSRSATDPAFSTTGDDLPIHNWLSLPGAWLADLSLVLFGFSVWWLVLTGWYAVFMQLARELRDRYDPAPRPASGWGGWRCWSGLMLLMSASSALEWTRVYALEARLPGHAGGVLGYYLGPWSMKVLGFELSGLMWVVILVMALPWVFRFSWGTVAETLGAWVDGLRERRAEQLERDEDTRLGELAQAERERYAEGTPPRGEAPPVRIITPAEADAAPPSLPVPDEADWEEPPPWDTPAAASAPATTTPVPRPPSPPPRPRTRRSLPGLDLLDPPPQRSETITPESLELTSRLIEKKLKDFGVQVRVMATQPGPVITRYEIEPATGVKGSQVVNLAKDLARSLSLVSIRVVETIPGKNLMALELPNPKRHTIRLSELLGAASYQEAPSPLTVALGKDIVGQPICADLARMPHCLVAGTTGSGKSVGINGMILSLLYNSDPKRVRLILIDPKMLEMSVYEGIGHLLCPVVTDMKQAANALTWCVAEMERRYKLMSKLGVRGLEGYNRKITEAAEREEFVPNPLSLTPDAPEPLDHLPCIVIVIDELADLMMVVGKKIEELIARLAQKARAAGIHLILATQRPSVDVITGLIKANIPTRFSYQVSSKIDSRTILDQMGAEALLGMGDMLYLPAGSGVPMRLHGAFVSDDEVHRVVTALKAQGEPDYIEGILEGGVLEGESSGGGGGASADPEADPLYDQAVALVLQHRRVSVSSVQRHLRIGYNRAARLVEQMEKAGLVSPMGHNGNRELLVPQREEG